MSLSSELRAFAGFLRGLPAYLRNGMTPEEARAMVRHRLETREAHFLTLAQRAIYGNPRSPYRKLLELAGCDLGDLRAMVRSRGLEGTLRELRASGVYVSFEEFKGTRPIVRCGQTIPARPEDFDNPFLANYHKVGTGGSTGVSRSVRMDLDHMFDRLPMAVLGDRFHGFHGVPNAQWAEMPPAYGLDAVLQRAATGSTPERWFTVMPRAVAPRFAHATRAALVVARLAGKPVPFPEHVPLDGARTIARWMERRLRERGACAMRGHVSRMLRIALAAAEDGIDLTGAVIAGTSEPPTAAKVARIRATGARFVSTYYFTEVGPVGLSCTATDDPNDQHLHLDHLALIQAPRAVPGFDVRVDAFHFTTLLPAAPKVLLNVESDDYGTVETRPCGCPFGDIGFTTHLREIRSFSKLTGEGVTLIGSDMERILEEVLPARFGGSALDWQMVEEEDERGFTRLTLLVSPGVHLADERAPIDVVLAALGRSNIAASLSGGIWAQADTLRLRREAPTLTARGKLMPLRVVRRPVALPPSVATPGSRGPAAERSVR